MNIGAYSFSRGVLQKSFACSLLSLIVTALMLGSEAAALSFQVLLGSFLLSYVALFSISKGGSVFHPLPITSLIMLWAMVYSPVFNVYFDHVVMRAPKVIDLNPSIYYVSWLYLLCICFYVFAVMLSMRSHAYVKVFHEVSRRRTVLLGVIFLLITLIFQILILSKFGGIAGFLASVGDRQEAFEGMGILFMVAESFPTIFLFLVVICFPKDSFNSPRSMVLFLLTVFLFYLAIKLFFGGFRGSRSNSVWGVLWFLTIVHVYYRRIPFYLLAVLGGGFIAFMLLYSAFKVHGADAFASILNGDSAGHYEESPFVEMLLNDFSRSGLHAYIFHQYFIEGVDYTLKYGQTYLNAMSMLLPLDGSMFASKNAASYEVFYGGLAGTSNADASNSRVYGLFGEFFLNFGVFVIFLPFVFFGFFVTCVDNFFRAVSSDNMLCLLLPVIANLCFFVLLMDSNNIVYFIAKNMLLPALFVMAISKVYKDGRVRVRA